MTPEKLIEADREEAARLRAEWLQYRARLHDPDTGLPTLAGIVDDLRKQLEEGYPLGVFTLSLHPESQLEESWGWQAYDRLVVEFIRTLKVDRGKGLVPDGILCVPAVRSDEVFLFVALGRDDPDSPNGTITDQAYQLDSYVKSFLSQRLSNSDRFRNYVGSSSIIADPKVRVERLIYRGIREARGEVYDRTARAESRGTEILRKIISDESIYPLFQPIFDLRTGRAVAFEALSSGPSGSGFEAGETLFSFAERAGLLLGLERVCRRRILEEATGIPAGQRLFINLSPAAASDNEFLEGAFERLVRERNFDPASIVVEITERTYALHHGLFTNVLRELRREGFLIAVDDMGTGYSSFSSLAEIEPDYLKFDSVFVHEIHRHKIKRDLLEAMLAFAAKSNTQVIAEGIEAPEELHTLVDLGVPFGQGFLLARPAPLAQSLRATQAFRIPR
jgi:EAL domain-containing protein (putative c-di-GMP-specific phosphodiesterase class I)